MASSRTASRILSPKVPMPVPPKPLEHANQGSGSPASKSNGRVVLYTVLLDVDNADGALMAEMTTQVFFVASQAPSLGLRVLLNRHAQVGADGTKFIGQYIQVEAGGLAIKIKPGSQRSNIDIHLRIFKHLQTTRHMGNVHMAIHLVRIGQVIPTNLGDQVLGFHGQLFAENW